MIWNTHSRLDGQHAFLSASKYHWVNYEAEKIESAYAAHLATIRGNDLHALAAELIRLGVKLPRTDTTLNMYVNDAIGYRMAPEQILYYSDNCYGTADAIGFRKNKLRIHDLKTGMTPASEKQLEIYAALFCLEYHIRPFEIQTELRIYQSDQVRVYEADPDVITHVMDKIKQFDKLITAMRMEAL